MASAAQFRVEHVQTAPRGWHTRTIVPGPRSRHEVRIAFPPGRRKKGSGRVVEILHPSDEKKNPTCEVSQKAKTNPGELLIFGNPSKLEQQRAARERAARIRAARLNQRKANAKGKAKLTPEEDRAWTAAFNYHLEQGKSDAQADRLAWRDVKKEFPRLRKFSGAKAQSSFFGFTNPKRRGNSRRNPGADEAKAVQLFQGFHGREPKAIVEKHVSAHVRLEYTALGDLEYVKVITPLGDKANFGFEGDGVKLASSPDGKQLYAIGGNQNLAHCLDKASQEKDFIDLGEAQEVQYLARKIHGEFRPVSYYHKFGEARDGSTKPRLMYDKLRKQIFFIGGEYWIDTSMPAPGTPLGRISPGIEN